MPGKLWWKLVRFGFRLLYNELAFTYDAVSWIVSLGQWRCWQRTSLKYLPEPENGIVLELAHGTGNLHVDLQNLGYNTVAFDLSPSMGHIARRKLSRLSSEPDFVQGSALNLPFADGSFNAIVSTFPTDFIVQADTLCEAHRVLSEDGTIVIVLNGILIGGGAIRAFLEWLYRITGQRNDESREAFVKQHFEGFSFEVKALEVPCRNSIAQLVILTKSI